MVKGAKSKKPIIGISCEVLKLRPYYSEFELACDYRYIRAIIRALGIPVMLPINHAKLDIKRLINLIDGLMIIGDADIHPTFYQEKAAHPIKPMYRGRTKFDMNLFQLAQQKKIPILAICYGMQLVNIIYGGTLYQDIQRQIRGTKSHRSKREPHHIVHLYEDSDLAKIFGKNDITVHSDHHQAIKTLGSSLRATGYSPDTVIEAVEGPPRTIAVQWHPERQSRDVVQSRLFNHFIKMCRDRKK